LKKGGRGGEKGEWGGELVCKGKGAWEALGGRGRAERCGGRREEWEGEGERIRRWWGVREGMCGGEMDERGGKKDA